MGWSLFALNDGTGTNFGSSVVAKPPAMKHAFIAYHAKSLLVQNEFPDNTHIEITHKLR